MAQQKMTKIPARYLRTAPSEARRRASTANRSRYSGRSAAQDATQGATLGKNAEPRGIFFSPPPPPPPPPPQEDHFPLAHIRTAPLVHRHRSVTFSSGHRQRRRRPRYSEKRAEGGDNWCAFKNGWNHCSIGGRNGTNSGTKRHKGWVRDGGLVSDDANNDELSNTKTPTTTPLPDRCGVVSWVAEENAMCAATWPTGRGVLGAWQHARTLPATAMCSSETS